MSITKIEQRILLLVPKLVYAISILFLKKKNCFSFVVEFFPSLINKLNKYIFIFQLHHNVN